MSDILSQAEIEALLSSLSDNPEGGTEVAQPNAGSSIISNGPQSFGGGSLRKNRAPVSYELYDFRRSDKFSKDQLKTLQILHETFARLGGTGLSGYLRTPVTVELVSLEQIPYEEYIRSINQSVFTVLSIPPLTGQAVMEIEFNLVFTMIDKLLGGTGKGISRRSLTDIEKPLVRQMVEKLFVALKNAWEGVVIVNPGIEAMETSSQFVQICPPSDVVVTLLFEVKIGASRGAMSICIPYLLLKPITTKLSAQKWFVNTSRKNNSTSKRLLSLQVGRSDIECTVKLGNSELSILEFLNLKVGDVLELDQKKDENLVLNVGEIPKFEGKPGLRGKRVTFTVLNTVDPE
ncbi:MAG: flagellar motor switch protein FliM [Armatimonadetes bacterium]|nr:flagellar motor switch protein FliM [Armatimonadota bacterium]